MDDFFTLSIETQLFLERTSAKTVSRAQNNYVPFPTGYDPETDGQGQAEGEVLDG